MNTAIPLNEAIGTVLAHDITEIRPGEYKGRAFKKGHVIRDEDVDHLKHLGKEHVFVLRLSGDEIHEDEAAYIIANALMGVGVTISGEPKEGKISIIAERDGLLKINKAALLEFNMLGEVMCATLHDNTVVKKGQVLAGTRAIPLVIKRSIVDQAVRVAHTVPGVVQVREIRKPKAGVVITGNEVYHGRIKDAFTPIIKRKIEEIGGELVGVFLTPDDKAHIAEKLRILLEAGADLLITTGGMSVDPDDVTRFAIHELGAEITYGSAVLPGAMVLVGYISADKRKNCGVGENAGSCDFSCREIPIIGIPACGMYADTTVFDLVLPRILAGDKIGRRELAELGHGGLCLKCDVCRYPVCPFGKLG